MAQKNETGLLGKICNTCGGYGYTNNLQGQSSGCRDCEQTGIARPSITALMEEIQELRKKVQSINNVSNDS